MLAANGQTTRTRCWRIPSLQLFVVADGMGGHRDGDVASRIIVEGIKQFFDDTAADADKTWPLGFDVNLSYAANRLKTAILIANLPDRRPSGCRGPGSAGWERRSQQFRSARNGR